MRIFMSLPTMVFTTSIMAACSPAVAFGISGDMPPTILSSVLELPSGDSKGTAVDRP